MAVDRLAFSSLSLGSEACFHCQEVKPGKEFDLAKCLRECGRGIGGPGSELKYEMWRNQITHCSDHFTQRSPCAALCRSLSQLLALGGNIRLLADPAVRCLTFRQNYHEDVNES